MTDRSRILLAALAVAVGGLGASSAGAQYSTPVRDVENPARTPVRISATASVPAGVVGSFGMPLGAAIAADRRLVVEHVNVRCGNSGAVEVSSVIMTTAQILGAGATAFHNPTIPLTKTVPSSSGNTSAVGSELVRWYHDGGNALQVGILLNDGAPAGGINCYFTVSGHTVSMP